MKSMKANQHASPVWRMLFFGIASLFLSTCSGRGDRISVAYFSVVHQNPRHHNFKQL